MCCFFVLGFSQTKNGQCYSLGFEIVPNNSRSFICSVINVWDLSFTFWLNLYIMLFSKQWFYIFAFYTLIGIIALIILTIFTPESPKWLHMQGRTQEAVQVLEKIARFNGSTKPITFGKDQIKNMFLTPNMNASRFMTPMMSIRSIISNHSALSDAAIEGIMGRQPIVSKLNKIK